MLRPCSAQQNNTEDAAINAFTTLKSYAGTWQGNNRLHDPFTGLPDDSPSPLTVTGEETGGAPLVRFAYTWIYQNKPQSGTITFQEEAPGQIAADWIDSWHTGGAVMSFHQVERQNESGLSLLGSYSAPPGPDWGWRIRLETGDAIAIRMYNISPEGEEDIAVESGYTRAEY